MAVHRLGVDIGATRLRVVLSSHGSERAIENIAVRDIPPGLSSSGLISDPIAVGNILRSAVDEMHTTESRCVLAISNDVARCVVSPFPARGRRKQRKSAAEFVAQEAFPELFEQDDAKDQLATVVLPHPDQPKQAVLLVVRRDALASRVEAAQAAGLRVDAVIHEAFAARLAFPTSTAVLDVGRGASRLYGFAEPLRPIVLSSPIGGDAFTQELAFELAVDVETAERRKRDEGAAPRVRLANENLTDWVGEMQAKLRELGVNLEEIVLVGNGARLREVPEIVEHGTAFPAALATLEGTRTAYDVSALARMAPDIALAYGLSLYEENAYIPNFARAMRSGWWNEISETLDDANLRLSAAACAAAVAIFMLTGVVQNVRLERAHQDESIAASRELAASRKFSELSAFVANVSAAVSIRDQLRAQRRTSGYFADYLAQIENAMPPHLSLSTVLDTGTGWTITGRTRDERFVATAIVGVNTIPGLSADVGPLTPIDPPSIDAALQANGAGLQDIPPEVREALLKGGSRAIPAVVQALQATGEPVPPALALLSKTQEPRVGFQIDVKRSGVMQ